MLYVELIQFYKRFPRCENLGVIYVISASRVNIVNAYRKAVESILLKKKKHLRHYLRFL